MTAVERVLGAIVEPGLLSSGPVHTALLVGGGAAVVSGVVGVFTVMRGQSFAGHALAGVSSAGGSLAFLLGMNPLLGFVVMAVIGAGSMESIGRRRVNERDLATGVVFGAGLALAALFLYFDATFTSTTGAAITVMMGSMFAIPPSTGRLALAVGLVALATVAVIYRPLLLSSASPELAAARGVRVGLAGLLYLLVLALAVALAAITVGAILSTALLIGPAAAALRIARRPGSAVLLAALIGIGTTWAGILLAYDSNDWTLGHGWPVSFCVVALVALAYVAARPAAARRRGRPSAAVAGAGEGG